MNYLSVCSGIEAASVSWEPLGWKCVGVSEIEPFPCAVLNHHFPTVPNFGDMTKFKEWKINGTVDLLAGGTPCQSFSVAGLRQGLKDPRGNLMLTFLAIAEHFKPKWILWENVPGVLSSNSGKDFGSFLGGLGELGYGFAYRVLDAQWIRTQRHSRAVPQRRRRVFVVGCLGDFTSAAKVLFERESLSRYSAPRRATRKGIAVNVEEGVGSDGKIVADVATVDARNNFDRGDSQHLDRLIPCFLGGVELCGPLKARDYKDIDTDGMNYNSAKLVPVAIPIMPQATQSEGWRVGKENQDGSGNGLGVGKDGDPCPTIDRSAVPSVAYSMRESGQGFWVEDDIAGTLRAEGENRPSRPSNVLAKILAVPAVAIQGTVIGRQDHNGPQGSGCSDSGEMFTLTKGDTHAVALDAKEITAFQSSELRLRGTLTNQDVSPTLLSETKMGDTELRVLGTSMQVRRLTPTECERLQGFPDGWTKIPWKNKSADECPDGPRYKALGNSMAVNCMEWLGERIQAVESGTL